MELNSLAGNVINGLILLALLIAAMTLGYWLMKRLRSVDRPDDSWSSTEIPAAGEIEIEDSKLSVAQAYLSSGESLDSVCGLLDPEFRKWSAERKAQYREQVRTRLAALQPVDEGSESKTA